jgi:hypothetical protein
MTILWSLLGIGVGVWHMWKRSEAIEEQAEGITHGV